MRVACASDAHASNRQIERLIATLPPVDAFCFMGDEEGDAEYLQCLLLEAQPRAAFYAVAGNSDQRATLPLSLEISLGKARAFVTHGHLFRVKLSLDMLAAHARGRDCALALFGHTHVPFNDRVDGVCLINPGALRDGRWALVDTDTEAAQLFKMDR